MSLKPVFSSVLIIVISLTLAVVLSFTYTTRAINSHARQACAQLHIIAFSGGAMTDYDKAIKKAYQQLYKLRCG